MRCHGYPYAKTKPLLYFPLFKNSFISSPWSFLRKLVPALAHISSQNPRGWFAARGPSHPITTFHVTHSHAVDPNQTKAPKD